MNYSDFYKNAKRRLTDALLSLWFSGKKKEQDYLRYVIEEKEPLLAEPVFQSIFPWESSLYTFEEHATKLKILDADFVKALSENVKDEVYKFHRNRYPYTHQTNSWEQLLNKKTIVVTSGTGSGKTECFMIPVLQDLYRQKKIGNNHGVQAISLYPLNALMDSQKKRIHFWCNSLSPKLTYAVYNGDTPDKLQGINENTLFPELACRKTIRNTPPQILFTNPTMLEYLLVRADDKPILQQSQGTLRWVILDETHTYSGSAAAELALQLRRVLDAFGVTVDDVNFATTSATIGEGGSHLIEFISQLTGKNINEIVSIDGIRIIPNMDDSVLNKELCKINNDYKLNISCDDIKLLRKRLNSVSALTLSEIVDSYVKNISIEEKLSIIDRLGNKVDDLCYLGQSDALLPSRAHFFLRSLGGLYACTNYDCEKDKERRISLGSLTTEVSSKCEYCGSQLLEIQFCDSCKNPLLVGELNEATHKYRMLSCHSFKDESLFEILQELDEEDEDTSTKSIINSGWNKFALAKNILQRPRNKTYLCGLKFDPSLSKYENVEEKEMDVFQQCMLKDGSALCPHCGSATHHLNFASISANFISRILSSTLLEQAEPMKCHNSTSILWEGRKFISFTDSRQGTAKSALSQNQDVEHAWIRSEIYHLLSDKRREKYQHKGVLSRKEFDDYNELLPLRGNKLVDEILKNLEYKINGNNNPSAEEISWSTIENKLGGDKDLARLFMHLSEARKKAIIQINSVYNKPQTNKIDYLKALFLDELGSRPRKSNSLETMGFVHFTYPPLIKANAPQNFLNQGWSDKDWRDFLKICIDYFIRTNRHYLIPDSSFAYLTQSYLSSPIYPNDIPITKNEQGFYLKKWPSLKKEIRISEKQPRIALLICAGFGIEDTDDISQDQEDTINDILREAWKFLSLNVLDKVDTQLVDGANYFGYKLNLFDHQKVCLQIIEKAWICPVNHVAVDVKFLGYSPLMTGYISSATYQRFKIESEAINYPYFPYAYGNEKDENECIVKVKDENDILKWIKSAFSEQEKLGLWSDLHEGIIISKPIYIAAEHSAQQRRETLSRFEEDFNKGELNILSCSTTMEMGVDIGGISEVVMNNVPPKPANYLQRAGRAGRRGESKAMSLTFCSPTPIGTNTFCNPKWAMEHPIAMPIVKLESETLVQRHINSFLFSAFVSTIEGFRVTESVENFFYSMNYYREFQISLNKIIQGNNNVSITSSYSRLIKGTSKSRVSIEESAFQCLLSLIQVFDILNNQYISLKTNKSKLEEESCSFIQTKAIQYQIDRLMRENLIGFLAEHNFIPSAGIPTGLVEFNPGYDKYDKNRKLLSRHLSMAISEFAPGSQVVLNEWCYVPSGIQLKSQWNETKRALIQNCPKCGLSKITFGNHLDECPHCGEGQILQGVQGLSTKSSFTEIIEPAGFLVDYNYEPTRKVKRNEINIIQPILLEMEPWRNDGNIFDIRCGTSQSEILYYNKGNGKGFALCGHCGKMIKENKLVGDENDLNPLLNHTHLHTGGHCTGTENNGNGIRRNVLLVGRYQTDLVEIRFKNSNNKSLDTNALWSLGVILSRKLAEYLGINQQEIGFGVNEAYRSIFIFDSAIGGAGYSILFPLYKEEILNMSRKTLENCQCTTACTSCLIDRETQWYMDKLDRIIANEWLQFEYILRTSVPQKIIEIIPDSIVVTSDLMSELNNVLFNPTLREVTFFITNDLSSWNPNEWIFNKNRTIQRLKMHDIKINLVMPKKDIRLQNLSASELATLLNIRVSYLLNFSIDTQSGIYSLMQASFSDGKTLHFFSDKECCRFNGEWGDNCTLYRSKTLYKYKSENWDIDFSTIQDSKNVMFDFKIKDRISNARTLGNLLYQQNPLKWDIIKGKIKGDEIKISYTDVYLKTPLSCFMLIHIIKWIADFLEIPISKLTLNLAYFNKEYLQYDGLIGQDFVKSEARNDFLIECSKEILGFLPDIEEGYLPHFRELKIQNKNSELIVRPDGGIENGWKIDRAKVPLHDYDLIKNINYDVEIFNREYSNQGILYVVNWKEK